MNTRLRNWLTAYVVGAVIFAVLDAAWILTVASPLYKNQIGHLLAPSTNLAGAVLFYLVFVAGMVHFGVRPHDPEAALRQRVTGGALFGFFTYATWALTGFAVLKDFTAVVVITDILWGAAACSIVTWLTAAILKSSLRKRSTA